MKTEALLEKYNKPVPRYTSYPPATCFDGNFGEADYGKAIDESNDLQPAHLSFYIHIPFCRHMCHYCGCNSSPMAKPDIVEQYLSALHEEIDRVTGKLLPSRKIAQIHYGGGTPTLLPIERLKELNEHLLSAFSTIDHPEIAIECHPAYLDENDWKALTETGFNRFSLGIQDMRKDVLAAVNRHSSLLPLKDIFHILRQANCRINTDFLYGLPLQTAVSFGKTIEQVLELRPDRLVTFSYAHVPWVNKRQQILEKRGLPLPGEKNAMFETARKLLVHAGYEPVGLDHFVQPDDELYGALLKGELRRNFQGYCTARTTGQVYAFGVSAISQLQGYYAQNSKDIDTYIGEIKKGKFATAKGYKLDEEERIVKEVIETLMCNYSLDWDELSGRLSLPVETIRMATAYKEELLREFAEDGIITLDDHTIRVTQEGRLFVRNVAASLDKRLLQTNHNYSKPV